MSYFSPFVDQSSLNLVGTSGDIRDQVAKFKISPTF